MSRVLIIFVVLSALATGAAIVLGLDAEPHDTQQFWPDFTRAVAVASWIVGALVWCTERICREIASLRAATREEVDSLRTVVSEEVASLRCAAGKQEKRTAKQLRVLKSLSRERIEAAHQVVDIFDRQRRAGNR